MPTTGLGVDPEQIISLNRSTHSFSEAAKAQAKLEALRKAELAGLNDRHKLLDQKLARLNRFMALEREVRSAPDRTALQYLMANETRKHIPAAQAVVWSARPALFGKSMQVRLEAISAIARPDPTTSTSRWLAAAIGRAHFTADVNTQGQGNDIAIAFTLAGDCDAAQSFPLKHATSISFGAGSGFAGLTLLHDTPLDGDACALLERLGELYAHAWRALSRRIIPFVSGKMLLAVAVAAVLLLAVPVPLAVLGQAEIVPGDPELVTAPMEGVIENIAIPPNSRVKKGQLLFTLEKTDRQAETDILARELELADARLRRAAQDSFGQGTGKGEGKREMALLAIEQKLAAAKLAHARERLAMTDILAGRDGVLLYNTADDWLGKPVVTGEAIMQIADPDKLELKIELPSADAMLGNEKSSIRFFSDARPLSPLGAEFISRTYFARPSQGGIMHFEIRARPLLDDKASDTGLMVGERGTAQLSGESVPLFYFLFRKPLGAARQFIGL